MSKWSDEFAETHKTVGKLKEETKEYLKMVQKDKEKYWIHREPKWGWEVNLKWR